MTTATAPVTAASAAQLLRLAGPTEAELRAFWAHYYRGTGATFERDDPALLAEWHKHLAWRAAQSNWPER